MKETTGGCAGFVDFFVSKNRSWINFLSSSVGGAVVTDICAAFLRSFA
jgi:hypothetical protein